MARLLVVLAREGRLDGAVADAVHTEDGERVFTLRGLEVARVRTGEHCVVRRLPNGRFPVAAPGLRVAAAG